jgi:uncharacterized protein
VKTAGFIPLLALLVSTAQAAEVIPPVPRRHFNDYANVVSDPTERKLDAKLADFEKSTSNQILVAVYPKMQSDSSIEDYTVRVAQKWGIGQKGRNNGAVLFVFVQDRSLYIQVGYGLEGALPDGLARQIIERQIKPRFRAGDYDGGLSAAVDAMIAATKGEYKADNRSGGPGPGRVIILVLFIAIIVIVIVVAARNSGPVEYSSRGRRRRGSGWPIVIPTGGWGGGGGWGGRGGGFGGGGFSAGGGSFGGGGAGGRW